MTRAVRIFVCLVFLAITASDGFAAPLRIALSKGTCPSIWRFTHDEDTDRYALVLRSATASRGDVNVRLSSGGQAFSAALPAVGIDIPTSARLVPFRSTPIVLHVPKPFPNAGIVVTFAGNLDSCPTVAGYIDTKIRASYNTPRPVPSYALLASSLDGEIASSPVHELAPQSGDDATCTTPDHSARPTKAIVPDYPQIARMEGQAGKVKTIVELDGAGNIIDSDLYVSSGSAALDRAGHDAAVHSTYGPASVACNASGGFYIFEADFASG